MKLINFQSYLLIIIPLIFSNCREQTVKVNLPALENKVIINAIISPDDTELKVRISKSQPAFGKNNEEDFELLILSQQIEGVIIKNTENNQKIVLSPVKDFPGSPPDGFINRRDALIYTESTSNFPIQGGKTYQLLVSMKDNIKITAQTTIPSSMVDITKVNIINNSIQWTDIKNKTNFYSVDARAKIVTADNFGGETFYFIELPLSNKLFRDENKDGKILSTRLDINEDLETYISMFNGGTSNQVLGNNQLEINVLSIPETFYDYLKAIEDYERYSDGSNNNPINIPSNIEGGALGIFSSYNAVKKIIDLN